MTSSAIADTVTLWRPTGQAEFDLVAASGHRAWPPRLPDQPIFYPVSNRAYATKIAREWNAPNGVGHVTRFDVRADFLARYEIHCVGAKDHLEYWIPAEDLDAMNANIVGRIRVVATYEKAIDAAAFEDAERELRRPIPPSGDNGNRGRGCARVSSRTTSSFSSSAPTSP